MHIYRPMIRSFEVRSVLRRLLGAVAMFGFSLNVATPTIMHGCAHIEAEAAASDMASAHDGHHDGHAPAEKPSTKKCQCVGQSCGTAMAEPTPIAAAPHAEPIVTRVAVIHPVLRRPAMAEHLLPFAVGPPSSLSA